VLNCSGFSVIDLIEDKHSHLLYALKRVTCHSHDDEKHAVREVDLMNTVCHRSLVSCEAHAVVPVTGHITAVSEVLIVMPYYKVSWLFSVTHYFPALLQVELGSPKEMLLGLDN